MFNPFTTVKTYSEMLNKIALYTWLGVIVMIAFMRTTVPAVDTALAAWSVPAVVVGIKIPLGTIAPAFLAAFVSRMFKLHDRVSDLLGIRERFDVAEILLPLAVLTRSSVTVEGIRANRRELMRRAFYQFASSSPGASAIPEHYVHLALDQWSWYWVIVENSLMLLISASAYASLGHFGASTLTLAIILASLWILQGLRKRCSNHALEEVQQILSDSSRRDTVMGAFGAVHS